MNTIEERKTNRYKLLKALYDATEGNTRHWADVKAITAHYNFERGEFEAAYQYLTQEGLIKLYGRGYTAHIAHNGIKAIEAAECDPTQPTAYFPAVYEMESVIMGTKEKL